MTEHLFNGQRILIAGGNSGMGLALVKHCLDSGARVIMAGRNSDKLNAARELLAQHQHLSTAVLDITDEASVMQFFKSVDSLDHIISTAANMEGAYGFLPDLPQSAFQRAFASKVLGPWLLAKYGKDALAQTGSITFVSGIAAYRPMPRGSIVAAANAAIEGLAKALAVELAPIRVNVVSPGWVDTPIWKDVLGDGKDQALQAMAEKLPVARIGQVDDIAGAMMFVMSNGFTTGSVLHCDGGHRLV